MKKPKVHSDIAFLVYSRVHFAQPYLLASKDPFKVRVKFAWHKARSFNKAVLPVPHLNKR